MIVTGKWSNDSFWKYHSDHSWRKKERKKKRFTGRELATEKKARVCLVIKAGRLNREISLKIDASTSNVTFPYSDFSLSSFFFFLVR